MRTDVVRRAATLLALVVVLLTVPHIAAARFVASTQAEQQVSTARLVAPEQVRGSYTCRLGFFEELLTVDLSSFVDNGPDGAQYNYEIRSKGQVLDRVGPVGAAPRTFRSSQGLDVRATPWTLHVQPVLKSWTGPWSSTTINCPFGNIGSGSF